MMMGYNNSMSLRFKISRFANSTRNETWLFIYLMDLLKMKENEFVVHDTLGSDLRDGKL